MCACVCMYVMTVGGWMWKGAVYLSLNKVMGVTYGWCLGRRCHRKLPWSSTEWRVWKLQAHQFLHQHNPWGQLSYRHGNKCHLFDAMLIYTLSSTFKCWLDLIVWLICQQGFRWLKWKTLHRKASQIRLTIW